MEISFWETDNIGVRLSDERFNNWGFSPHFRGAEVPGEDFKVVIAELDVTHFVEVSRETSELEQF